MTLSSFVHGDNALSPTAALQQALMLVFVDYYKQGQLANYLAQHGSFAVLNFAPYFTTWTPGWTVFRSNDDYGVVISGTAEWRHWAVDLLASVPGSWDVPEMFVHPGFGIIARTILTSLQTLLPLPANLSGRISVSGFSLGGALASLVALVLVERYGTDKVELMTFGAPRYMMANWVGPWPRVAQRVVLDGDWVPDLPPQNTQTLLDAGRLVIDAANTVPRRLIYGRPARYQHYNRCFVMKPDGSQVLRVLDTDEVNFDWDANRFQTRHSSAAYFRCMRNWEAAQ